MYVNSVLIELEKRVYISVVFRTFIILCNYLHHLIPEYFDHPQKKPADSLWGQEVGILLFVLSLFSCCFLQYILSLQLTFVYLIMFLGDTFFMFNLFGVFGFMDLDIYFPSQI